MEAWIWVVPAVLMVLYVGIRVWKTYKRGLFLALLQLGATVVAAVAAFGLTRLLLNPGTVDLFGFGQALYEALPGEVAMLGTGVENLIRALPTAMFALVVFTVVFILLRVILWAVMRGLDRKFGWSQKLLCFEGHKLVAMVPGLASAVICLLVQLVLFNGLLCVFSNALVAVQAVADVPALKDAAAIVQSLAESPAITITDDLGCRWAFNALTTGQKDGETFSVGKQMIGVAKTAAGLDKVKVFLPGSEEKPTGDDFRALPEYLKENPEILETASIMLESVMEEMLTEEAVEALSQMMQTTPEQVREYLDNMELTEMEEHITTLCNVAAILADKDLLPEKIEDLDMEALEDPELQEKIMEEILKNEKLAELLGMVAS